MTRTSPLIRYTLWASLGLASLGLAACGSSDDGAKAAGSASVIELDFGTVSIQEERVMSFTLKSSGASPLVVSSIIANGEGGNRYKVLDDDGLKAAKAGLAAGKTANIQVAYHPCPAAWTEDGKIKADHDFDSCQLKGSDTAELRFVANAELAVVNLSGKPGVTPAETTVRCLTGDGHCGESEFTSAVSEDCGGLIFGEVKAGESCDLALELVNKKSGDAAHTAALLVEHAEVMVQKDGVNVSGAEAGFELLDADKNPLQFPLRVEIPAGEMTGKERIWVRFSAKKDGVMAGVAADQMGLRLFTNAKDAPKAVNVTAQGVAPQLQPNPASVNFGKDVQINDSKDVTVQLRNSGSAALTISDISLSPSDGEFTLAPVTTPATVGSGAKLGVKITYKPVDSGQDVAKLVVKSDDPSSPTLEIPVRGGPVPNIDVQPPISLQLPDDDAEGTIKIINSGYGELRVSELNLSDIGEEGSVDDFTVEGCTKFPCDPSIVLCPATEASCTKSETELKVSYHNNDLSTVDFVNLTMKSNDPTNPEYRLLLSAKSNPCLLPQPTVTVVSDQVCHNKKVELKVGGIPGGPKGETTTIDKFDWEWVTPWDTEAEPKPVSPGSATFEFTAPNESATMYLRLKVTNSCGAQSQGFVVTRLEVSTDC